MKRRKLSHHDQLMLPGFVEPILSQISAQGLPIEEEPELEAHYRARSDRTYARYRELTPSGQKCERVNLLKVREEQGGCCYYCDLYVAPRCDQFDHIMPRSRGFLWIRENVAMACGPCNLKKSDWTPQEIFDQQRAIIREDTRSDPDGWAAFYRLDTRPFQRACDRVARKLWLSFSAIDRLHARGLIKYVGE